MQSWDLPHFIDEKVKSQYFLKIYSLLNPRVNQQMSGPQKTSVTTETNLAVTRESMRKPGFIGGLVRSNFRRNPPHYTKHNPPTYTLLPTTVVGFFLLLLLPVVSATTQSLTHLASQSKRNWSWRFDYERLLVVESASTTDIVPPEKKKSNEDARNPF